MSMDGQPQELQPNTIATEVVDMIMPTMTDIINKAVRDAVQLHMAPYATKSMLAAQLEAVKSELRNEIKAQQKPIVQRVDQAEKNISGNTALLQDIKDDLKRIRDENQIFNQRLLEDQQSFREQWTGLIKCIQQVSSASLDRVGDLADLVNHHDDEISEYRINGVLLTQKVDQIHKQAIDNMEVSERARCSTNELIEAVTPLTQDYRQRMEAKRRRREAPKKLVKGAWEFASRRPFWAAIYAVMTVMGSAGITISGDLHHIIEQLLKLLGD